jgi:hypothetical protein
MAHAYVETFIQTFSNKTGIWLFGADDRVLVKTVMNLRDSAKGRKSVDQLNDCQLLNNVCTPWNQSKHLPTN